MNAPCIDIASILNAVSSIGASVYTSNMPDKPDTCIAVIDGPGSPPAANYVYDRPSVQVKVRAIVYTDAYALMSSIKSEIHGLANTVVGGAYYIQILAQGGIMSLGYDKNERVSLVLNFAIHRTTI